MEYVDDICKMLNMKRETFIEYAVARAVNPYLNENGEFKPERGVLIMEEEDSAETIECTILGACTIMGHQYVKVFANGTVTKVPEYCVKTL